jgi:hypothetical protein
MDVRVLVHLETVPGDQRLAWWAESPDVPGFSALDDDLPSLIVRTNLALEELLEDRQPIVSFELVSDPPRSDNPAPDAPFIPDGQESPGGESPRNPGQEGLAVTARPTVSAA